MTGSLSVTSEAGKIGSSTFDGEPHPPAITLNRSGTSPFILVCDHASNRIPAAYEGLGLDLITQQTHITWDPGALSVSLLLSKFLDATLVYATFSRLLIDPNRPIHSDALVPSVSAGQIIPGNSALDESERARRITNFHQPFHETIDHQLCKRLQAGQDSTLVAIHTFTPRYLNEARPWPVGLLPAKDLSFSQKLFDALRADDATMNVGWNQPYAAADGVYCTLEKHADARQIQATLIELRNDELLTPAAINNWAEKLARCLVQTQQNSGA